MLRRAAGMVVCLAWSLWLGGLAAVFVFVIHLFSLDRALAIQTAPHLFMIWEKYQIVLAAFALLGAALWRIARGGMRVTVIFWLLALCAVGASLGPVFVTRRMFELWSLGQSSGPEFEKLHGESMLINTIEGVVLLLVGFLLPSAFGGRQEEKSV